MTEAAISQDPRILVFATEKISDPAIDLAGLLKLSYPPTVFTIQIPCSSSVKPRWILHAFEKGFDGVFIAADGTDCPYSDTCIENTARIISETHEFMKSRNIDPAKLRMAAICSVCAESFTRHMKNFHKYLSNN